MPKITKKISRGSCMMDALAKMDFDMETANGKNLQEDNAKIITEDSAADWMEKCGELTNDMQIYGNKKSTAADKKMKSDNHENSIKSWQKNFSEAMKKQVDRRKRSSESLLRSLSTLVTRLEEDGNTLQDNDQRLQQWYAAQMKLSQQSVIAYRQKLQAIKQIHAEYMKEVEGLITRGAMKADERPLWYDVYRAFPPLLEPKFARPAPAKEPIRPIFYPEDELRAKFHSLGHGFGAINMLSTSGDTHIKRLVRNYEKLKAEGLPENELIEQSVAIVASEPRSVSTKHSARTKPSAPTPTNPKSVTSQLFAENDIFIEK